MSTLTADDRQPLPGLATGGGAHRAVGCPPMYGVVALAVSLGVQWMIIGLLLWGPLPRSRALLRTLTFHAAAMVRPERDLQIYAAGCLLTLVLIGILLFAWRRVFGRHIQDASETRRQFSQLAAAIQLFLSVGGLLVFLALVFKLPADPHHVRFVPDALRLMFLVTPGIFAIAAAAIDFQFRLTTSLLPLVRLLSPLPILLSVFVQLILALDILRAGPSTTISLKSIPSPLIAAGAALSLMLIAAIRFASRRRKRTDARCFWTCIALESLVAAASLLAFLVLLIGRFASGPIISSPLFKCTLLIPAAAGVTALLLDFRFGSRADVVGAVSSRRRQLVVDVVIAGAILITLFIPHSRWAALAGSFFPHDELHHWNYFALGPALQYAHGAALFTGAYSQYGMGWPYLFAKLRHLIPLSYANIVGMGMLYGCIYFIALYALLRRIVGDAAWAGSAVILGITLQLFSGLAPNDLDWNFPSSTILRNPMDVWFFLVLLRYLRVRNTRWLWLAGAISGLAVLFELDTGVHLAIVFAFFWLLEQLPITSLSFLRSRRFWLPILQSSTAALLVLVGGLLLGTRGTLFTSGFWRAYTEGLHNQAFSGLGLIPIAAVERLGIPQFAIMVFVYLFAIGLGIMRCAMGRKKDNDLTLACMGAYGLALLLLFVGRSHPYNLFHPILPFVIVSTMLLHQARVAAARYIAWTSIPWAVAICSLVLLWTKPDFLLYPSALRCMFTPPDRSGTLISAHPRDLLMPTSLKHDALNIQRTASTLRRLRLRDGDVAFLDDRDTLFYYLADLAPWSRNSALFHGLLTRAQLEQTRRELLRRRPLYVVIRAKPPSDWPFADLWTSFRHLLPTAYHIDRNAGEYQFWRRNS